MTSALGHAALNRSDLSGQRAVDAQAYKDLQTELKRTNDQLAGFLQHRPAANTVQAEIDGLKNWRCRESALHLCCTVMNGKAQRDFCQQTHTLNASALREQADALAAAAELQRIEHNGGGKAMEADPQAAVLLALVKKLAPSATMEDIQTAMSVFVALLLEVGSGFGMYIAFSQWRLYDREAPAAPAMSAIMTVTEPVVVSLRRSDENRRPAKTPRVTSANDNVNKASAKLVAPENGMSNASTRKRI